MSASQPTTERVANLKFSITDRVFQKACDLADVMPTKRQASKFRRGHGRAFSMKAAAVEELEKKTQ